MCVPTPQSPLYFTHRWPAWLWWGKHLCICCFFCQHNRRAVLECLLARQLLLSLGEPPCDHAAASLPMPGTCLPRLEQAWTRTPRSESVPATVSPLPRKTPTCLLPPYCRHTCSSLALSLSLAVTLLLTYVNVPLLVYHLVHMLKLERCIKTQGAPGLGFKLPNAVLAQRWGSATVDVQNEGIRGSTIRSLRLVLCSVGK